MHTEEKLSKNNLSFYALSLIWEEHWAEFIKLIHESLMKFKPHSTPLRSPRSPQVIMLFAVHIAVSAGWKVGMVRKNCRWNGVKDKAGLPQSNSLTCGKFCPFLKRNGWSRHSATSHYSVYLINHYKGTWGTQWYMKSIQRTVGLGCTIAYYTKTLRDIHKCIILTALFLVEYFIILKYCLISFL